MSTAYVTSVLVAEDIGAEAVSNSNRLHEKDQEGKPDQFPTTAKIACHTKAAEGQPSMVAHRRSRATGARRVREATAPFTYPRAKDYGFPLKEAYSDAEDNKRRSTELVLSWIGFDVARERELVMEELEEELEDFFRTTHKELDELAKTLMSRSTIARKVSIGFQRLEKLKAVIYWAKDCLRIGMPATVGSDTEEAKTTFLEELEASTKRNFIREEIRDSRDTRDKNAQLRELTDEGSWYKWEGQVGDSLIFMLESLQGPFPFRKEGHDEERDRYLRIYHAYYADECRALSRLEGTAQERLDEAVYDNFVDECIALSRLEALPSETDGHLVTRLLQSLPKDKSSPEVSSLEKALFKKKGKYIATPAAVETSGSDSSDESDGSALGDRAEKRQLAAPEDRKEKRQRVDSSEESSLTPT
jgi:sugar-specific transcriptional regulator TrmB